MVLPMPTDAERTGTGTSPLAGLPDAQLIARYEAIRLKARTAEQQGLAAELERRCKFVGVVRAGAIQYAWSGSQGSLVRTNLGIRRAPQGEEMREAAPASTPRWYCRRIRKVVFEEE